MKHSWVVVLAALALVTSGIVDRTGGNTPTRALHIVTTRAPANTVAGTNSSLSNPEISVAAAARKYPALLSLPSGGEIVKSSVTHSWWVSFPSDPPPSLRLTRCSRWA